MSLAKRARIRRAGQRLWRDRFKADPSVDRLRFDAASVVFHGERADIDYVVAAF
jgi:putative endonuclease